ncbi:hypothetical protein TIFTF001_017328 [Ficus carica]|uniref:Uncharacterized protein n=1 Tax=Ficus carica TaxID=3494 RepID=A0AA88A7V4_FICCA|nr:hypothetical protein TIFTF001_017328 [Ficus carica]
MASATSLGSCEASNPNPVLDIALAYGTTRIRMAILPERGWGWGTKFGDGDGDVDGMKSYPRSLARRGRGKNSPPRPHGERDGYEGSSSDRKSPSPAPLLFKRR